MKTFIIIAAVVGSLLVGVTGAQAFTPPTSETIATLVSAPSGIAPLIKDATPQQAADVLLKGIEAIDAAKLSDEQKKQLIARLVAYAVAQMGKNAPDMMALVVRSVSVRNLQLVVASAMVAAPDYMNAMQKAILDALGADTEKGRLAAAAVKNPHAVLGDIIYQIIKDIAARRGISSPPSPYNQ